MLVGFFLTSRLSLNGLLILKNKNHVQADTVTESGNFIQQGCHGTAGKLISQHLHFQNTFLCPCSHFKWSFCLDSSLRETNTY